MRSEPTASVLQHAIPLCVPEIRGNEWTYVKECLDTNYVSSVGAFVDRFEQALAKRLGLRYAVATTSGTAALHTAMLVAGVEPDDEVAVSTLTFIAPVNAIRYVGAWPIFIDSEPRHWQMDPERLRDFCERGCSWQKGELRNKVTGRRVKALVPVHILGHPVNMEPVLETARRFNLRVIEDATESLGATIYGRPVGTDGDIACFSFNGNKIMTTGGGGMITTNIPEWAQRAKYLTTQAKDDPVEFVHGAIGYNYRLTNIQAALGVAQLEQLDDYVLAKRRIASTYAEGLATLPGIEMPIEASWARSAFWLSSISIDSIKFGLTSRQLLARLADARIQARPLWQPGHLSPVHRQQDARCPIAEMLNQRVLSLPSSVGLSEMDQQRVIVAVREAHATFAARSSIVNAGLKQ